MYKSNYYEKLSIIEFDAYQRLFQLTFHPAEIEILFMLDREYTTVLNSALNKRTSRD